MKATFLAINAGVFSTARHKATNNVVKLQVPRELVHQAVDVSLVNEDGAVVVVFRDFWS